LKGGASFFAFSEKYLDSTDLSKKAKEIYEK
jgi:hypothetical protein